MNKLKINTLQELKEEQKRLAEKEQLIAQRLESKVAQTYHLAKAEAYSQLNMGKNMFQVGSAVFGAINSFTNQKTNQAHADTDDSNSWLSTISTILKVVDDISVR